MKTTAKSRQADALIEVSKVEPAPIEVTHEPQLPETLQLGVPMEVPMLADRSLRVTFAPQGVKHAIVYLHGMCGNSKSADPWSAEASAYGTLIVVRADVPCEDRPGYKWPKEPELIQARIDAALEKVKEERNGLLETAVVSLFGYSQGAHRAELLAGTYPERYPRLFLGGPPTAPTPELLRKAQRVAVLGGELEDASHMQAGASDLIHAGILAEFFLLPHAAHGDYGPQGKQVVGRALHFLYPDGPQDL